jgi:hypothetical protein
MASDAVNTPVLRLKRAPAGQGLAWVRNAFRLYRRRPIGFTGMLSAFLLVSLAASVLLPIVGGVIAVMALPLLTLGFMVATQAALRDAPVHLGQFVEPLRLAPPPRRRALLLLCAIYGVLMIGVFLCSNLVDGDALDKLMSAQPDGKGPSEATVLAMAPQLMTGLLMRFGLTALLAIPFWHAPALIYWAGQGVGQSLFSSTLACWRNRGAFVIYGLVWLALVLAFAIFATSVFALLGAPQLLGGASVAAALVFTAAFYLSLYFTVIDSFERVEPRPHAPAVA